MTEYLAENARLRQLSRRYAEGEITLEEFRATRREIIEALEAGRVQSAAPAPAVEAPRRAPDVDVTGIRLPEDSEVFYKTTPPHAMTADAAPVAVQEAGWDSPTRILALVLVVSLLIAVSALVYVFAL